MKFCSNCGNKLGVSYPKECKRCGKIHFERVDSVATLLVPVLDGERIGILVGMRNISPAFGTWALPGGYIGKNESAEFASVRELHEETGMLSTSLTQAANFIVPMHTRVSSSGCLVIFLRSQFHYEVEALKNFKKNEECIDVKVCWEPEELGFSYHTEALDIFFHILPSIRHEY